MEQQKLPRVLKDEKSGLVFGHRSRYPRLLVTEVPESVAPRGPDISILIIAGTFIDYVDGTDHFDIPRKHGLITPLKLAAAALSGYIQEAAHPPLFQV